MTREIADNKHKARLLLTQMMPVEVANTLLRTGKADQCESFDCVTIAFVKVETATERRNRNCSGHRLCQANGSNESCRDCESVK